MDAAGLQARHCSSAGAGTKHAHVCHVDQLKMSTRQGDNCKCRRHQGQGTWPMLQELQLSRTNLDRQAVPELL